MTVVRRPGRQDPGRVRAPVLAQGRPAHRRQEASGPGLARPPARGDRRDRRPVGSALDGTAPVQDIPHGGARARHTVESVRGPLQLQPQEEATQDAGGHAVARRIPSGYRGHQVRAGHPRHAGRRPAPGGGRGAALGGHRAVGVQGRHLRRGARREDHRLRKGREAAPGRHEDRPVAARDGHRRPVRDSPAGPQGAARPRDRWCPRAAQPTARPPSTPRR